MTSAFSEALLDAVVIGSSGHAASIIDIIERMRLYRIVGLLDRFKQPGTQRLGYTILGGEDDIVRITGEYRTRRVFLAIGDNWNRSQSVKHLREYMPDLEFPSAVHPHATVGKGVRIGSGSVVMAGVVMNAYTEVHDFCIVNTSASVDHECSIHDYASIAPGATLGGRVKVGRFSAVCLGAKVIHHVSIGEHSILGAGSTLLKDLPDRVVAHGAPARVSRAREIGEAYL